MACHTLPRKNAYGPRIITWFWNRKQARKLKGSGIYFNEHLTKKNIDIARNARIMKKQNKVWIRLNGMPEEAKTVVLKN